MARCARRPEARTPAASILHRRTPEAARQADRSAACGATRDSLGCAAMASDASPRSPLKRALITSLKVGLYGFLVGLIALIVAVFVAMSSLPSYDELVRRNDLGQMIRV